MPTTAPLPARTAYPLTPEQARAAATVTFVPIDPTDRLTRYLDRMVEGDHWLRGRGWVGPWPVDDASPETATIREETRRGFVSRNVLAEIIKRHANGVLGREPRFDAVLRGAPRSTALTEAQQREKADLLAALTAWWDKTKPHRAMKEALRYALYCRRGLVRPYIHTGKLAQLVGASTEDGTVEIPEVATLADALDLISVEAVHPRQGAVTESARDGSPVSVVYYTRLASDGRTAHPRVEWAFLTPDRETLLIDEPAEMPRGRARAFGAQPPASAALLSLGGRVPTVQFAVEPIVVPSMLPQQATVNFAISVLPRVLGDAGWMERIFLNVEPPGTWQYDENGGRIPGTFRASDFVTGARTTNFMQGVVTENEGADGVKTAVANGSVVFRPPVNPEYAIKSARAAYMLMLEEAGQLHVFLQQEGEASGRSHEMARADYEGTLDDTATSVNPAGRALLENVVAMAEDLLGAPGRWTEVFRLEFQCRLSTGARTADEEQADNQALQANRISVDTVMERSGIDDVAAERERINADPDVQIKRIAASAAVMEVLVRSNLDAALAAEIAGMPEAVVTKIRNAPPPPLADEPTTPPGDDLDGPPED